ncbi:MAG: hypothetical protein ACR2OO_03935, partial [Thermomicrobiales bacterium]
MSAAAVLAELEARGVTIFIDGDALRFRARKGGMTEELRAMVAANRAALMATLADDAWPSDVAA